MNLKDISDYFMEKLSFKPSNQPNHQVRKEERERKILSVSYFPPSRFLFVSFQSKLPH